jgi:hypothetical protein
VRTGCVMPRVAGDQVLAARRRDAVVTAAVLALTAAAVVLSEILSGWRGTAAAVFSVLMALSRAYLGAYWLSDALAGVLLGASCALLAAFALGELQGRRTAHRAARSAHPPVPGTLRPADRR